MPSILDKLNHNERPQEYTDEKVKAPLDRDIIYILSGVLVDNISQKSSLLNSTNRHQLSVLICDCLGQLFQLN